MHDKKQLHCLCPEIVEVLEGGGYDYCWLCEDRIHASASIHILASGVALKLRTR
jgi:hypothetical protein